MLKLPAMFYFKIMYGLVFYMLIREVMLSVFGFAPSVLCVALGFIKGGSIHMNGFFHGPIF